MTKQQETRRLRSDIVWETYKKHPGIILKEIAFVFGISRERVRQILAKENEKEKDKTGEYIYNPSKGRSTVC